MGVGERGGAQGENLAGLGACEENGERFEKKKEVGGGRQAGQTTVSRTWRKSGQEGPEVLDARGVGRALTWQTKNVKGCICMCVIVGFSTGSGATLQ